MQKPITQKTLIFTLILVLCFSIAFNPILSDSPISDSTFTIGTQVKSKSFIIFKEGSYFYAQNGKTGNIDYSGTNNSLIINNAIASLGSQGGEVFLCSGEYVNPNILITNWNIKLTGEGKSTVLKNTGVGGTILHVNNTVGAVINNLCFLEIGGDHTATAINDTFTDHSLYYNLWIGGFHTGFFHNSSISNFKMLACEIGDVEFGIRISNCHDCMIQNSMFAGCNNTAIQVDGSYNLQIVDSSLEDSDSLSGNGYGIHLTTIKPIFTNARLYVGGCFFNHLHKGIVIEDNEGTTSRIIGNTFFKMMHIGIEDNEGGNSFFNNEFNTWYTGSIGIFIQGHYSHVVSNAFWGGHKAIWVNNTVGTWNNLVISNNQIKSYNYSIVLDAVAYSTITGNDCKDGLTNILISGGSIYNVISGCITRSASIGLNETGSADGTIIHSCDFVNNVYVSGANTHINNCWNGTSWIS